MLTQAYLFVKLDSMTATEQLKQEHEAILLMLQILEEISERLKNKKEVDLNDLKKILEFIRVFSDKCHHGKEEDLLFPALEKAGVPKDGGPIEMMLTEHDSGRAYIKGLSSALESKSIKEIIENIDNYVSLLREHIDKENNILYQIADMHLSQKEQENLLKEFEKLEEERIGHGKHEEFHKLLEGLEKLYLK
ncbi:MAG: hemerythrin domain-containing protein [bacterium]|nr:hemerythrin domain-containing protein [bacterium]